eukprot:3045569-Pleurochrysis_carterae.AAC.1
MQVRDFIEEQRRQRKPSRVSENADEKRLATWVNHQQTNYARQTQIMQNASIREEWATFLDAYPHLFEDGVTAWRRKFREAQDFMKDRGLEYRPSARSNNAEEKRLSKWIENQQTKYTNNARVMKDLTVRDDWAGFIAERRMLVNYHVTVWRHMLQKLQKFIEKQGGEQRPSRNSQDIDERRLGNWIQTQERNYKKNAGTMENVAIRAEWENFVETHPTFFGEGSRALRRMLHNFQNIIEGIDELSSY